jgi:PmbA protein
MDLKKLGESVVTKARKLGAHEAEAFMEWSRNFDVTVRKGEIETLQKSVSQGMGLRVFVNRQLGFSYTSDLSEKSLDDTVRKTIELARVCEPKPWQGLPDLAPGPLPDLDLHDPELAAVPDDRKIAIARDCEKTALALDPRLSNSEGGYFSDSEREVNLISSRGIARACRQTRCSFGVYVIAGEGDNMQGGGWSSSRRFFKELEPIELVAKTAVQRAVEMLGARPVETKVVPVVFDRYYAAPNFWMGLLFSLNGDAAFRKTTFMTEQLGKDIASTLITLADDPTIPRFVSSIPFDGEGRVTRRNVIVDKGVLKMFIYDAQTARKAGVAVPTMAGRGDYRSLPYASFNSIVVENGASAPSDLLRDIPEGLYVKGMRGMGTDSTTGSFSTGASGFWIKDGSLAYPVDGVTLGGSALEILKGIDRVANDRDLRGRVNSPSFRVSAVTVGGKKA